MISWMQKHKKYLVITIWISTIAFVGAGFVGWGAYKFGSGADSVAKVGEVKITYKDLRSRYQLLYDYYAMQFGGEFDQARAKEMELEKKALESLIQEALLQNFAKEHGLVVTDEEVAQKIASMKAFHNDKGVFDKELYKQILAQKRLKPKDFEESVRKDLLIQKLDALLRPVLADLEFDTVAGSLYVADKIKYLPMKSDEIEVSVDEKALREFYEKNKERFYDEAKFKVGIIEVPATKMEVDQKELEDFYRQHRTTYTDTSGKILEFEAAKDLVLHDLQLKKAKKEALRRYIELKKGKKAPQKIIVISQNDPKMPKELLQKLQTIRTKEVVKPKLLDDRYIIAQLIERIPPKPLPFEVAYEDVKKAYLQEMRLQKLQELAKKRLDSFDGRVTGFICRDDAQALKDLDPAEAGRFLNALFLSTQPKGIVPTAKDRVVLYEVLDQKLGKKEKIDKNRDQIADNALRLKQSVQQTNLIKKLENLYEIKIY